MVTLETVEVPGLREALKREARVRDTAFLDGNEVVCGVEVVPLSLRRLIWLEQAHNGFVVPWRFESDEELLAHSLQLVYFCTPSFVPPHSPRFSFLSSFREGMRQDAFFRKALRANSPDAIIKEVADWTGEAFMDAPAGGGNNEVKAPSYASYPAYIVDRFAEAGLPFSYDQIMDMPLRRLWQHWRVAAKRMTGAHLTNPSDDLATKVIAGVKR
jgi:hypothetical protein